MTAGRMSRRAVLAFIALADAPTPKQVRFDSDEPILMIDLDSLAALPVWGVLLGAPPEEVAAARISEFTSAVDGRPMRATAVYPPTWHGWEVFLHAVEYADAAPAEVLDPATRARLAALTAVS